MTEDQTILEFKDVIVSDYRQLGREISGVTFEVEAGELVLIENWPGSVPLADCAEGLIVPKSGRVYFQGNDWEELSPAAAARARGRIGRFFPGSGWVSNLNVDENITLSLRHHSHRPLEEIDEEAKGLSERLGLPPPPPTRPALLEDTKLTRFQLVRAFLGPPSLIILDKFPASGYNDALNNEIGRVRENGTGVLIITHDLHSSSGEFSAATRIYRVEKEIFKMQRKS